MKHLNKLVLALVCLLGCTPAWAFAFKHIVVIVQENRTPDNLFWQLCLNTSVTCGAGPGQYDILTSNWLDDRNPGGTNPLGTDMQNCIFHNPEGLCWDASHSHTAFLAMCHKNAQGNCQMNEAYMEGCSGDKGACGQLAQFPYYYVSSNIDSYLSLATLYGWANRMFQTNEGPSFPAHQFLFGATSAPTQPDDGQGIYASENPKKPNGGNDGCTADPMTTVQIIHPDGDENSTQYPCFIHNTIPDLFNAANVVTWRYYTANEGLWNAPDAIQHICGGSNINGMYPNCLNADYVNNVDEQNPSDVLCNASAGPLPGCSNTGFQKYCDLKSVSWVTPVGDNSDHPGNSSGGGGPDWVASIVDAIGHSTCADAGGSSYWNDTAIVITWDDWGGWPDHVQPTFLLPPKGDYQYGFRVPLLFVSAYTYNPGSVCGTALIDNNNYDFGSIARFIEGNFLGAASEGALGFADFRAANDLSAFYPNSTACPFMQVPHHKGAQWFLKHKPSSAPPDND